jgi:hypothetical protein
MIESDRWDSNFNFLAVVGIIDRRLIKHEGTCTGGMMDEEPVEGITAATHWYTSVMLLGIACRTVRGIDVSTGMGE